MDEDLAGRGDRFGLDQLVAELGEAADLLEALLRVRGLGPGVELVEVEVAVLADVDDGEAAVGEEAEEEAELGGREG